MGSALTVELERRCRGRQGSWHSSSSSTRSHFCRWVKRIPLLHPPIPTVHPQIPAPPSVARTCWSVGQSVGSWPSLGPPLVSPSVWGGRSWHSRQRQSWLWDQVRDALRAPQHSPPSLGGRTGELGVARDLRSRGAADPTMGTKRGDQMPCGSRISWWDL